MKKIIIILFVVMTAISSCKVEREEEDFSIITWNMYSFFDEVEDGDEYDGFDSKNYTIKKYENRVLKTSSAISKHFSDATLIVLEEVESEHVLKDLLTKDLIKKGYKYYGIAPGEGLKVGYISKVKPKGVKVHKAEGESRYILELDFLLKGEEFVVFSLHLRSRLKIENDEIRKKELSFLSYLISEHPYDNVIVVGDFNTSPEFYDGCMSLDSSKKETPIIITGDGASAYGNKLYSEEYDREHPLSGWTYHYKGEYSFLDHALCNYTFFDGDGWEYDRTEIRRIADGTDGGGNPILYDVKTESGYSDHFALFINFHYT